MGILYWQGVIKDMSGYNVNVMEVRIVDLQGQEYDINDIVVSGNDFISIRIKKPSEDYI